MTSIPASQTVPEGFSRRNLVRKAAYTTPAVFVIAAAPGNALGASGPQRQPPKTGNPNEPENPPPPGNTGNDLGPTNKPTSRPALEPLVINTHNPAADQAVAYTAGGPAQVPVVRQLPATGAGDDLTDDASRSTWIVASSVLAALSATGAKILRRDQDPT